MVSFGKTTVFAVSKLTRPVLEEKMYLLLKENGLAPVVKGANCMDIE